MYVHCLTHWEQLAPYAERWNRLAGSMPFHRWEWLASWWRHYGQPNPGHRTLTVLVVEDTDGEMIGLAPWYLEQSPLRGRVLRFLGGDEVCSDHLSLFCKPGREAQVIQGLVQWLTAPPSVRRGADRFLSPEEDHQTQTRPVQEVLANHCEARCFWDWIELDHVDRSDPILEAFGQQMACQGHWVERAPAGHCWVIDLPETWETFLHQFSSSRRRRLRQVDRLFFATGRAVLHTAKDPDQLTGAMDLLVRLHRKRRQEQGEADCFVSSRFEAFHRQMAPSLWAAGCLELHWLEVDGQPVAAEYHLKSEKTVYAYQSGMSPTAECPTPGHWIHQATIRRAIELGYHSFDFLRGDESYKAHWGAKPRPTETLWIVASHRAARWRYGLFRTGRRLKGWLKRWLKPSVASSQTSTKSRDCFQTISPAEATLSARGDAP